jgi:exportin-7
MPYLKGDAPSQLDAHVPKITRAYIESRLASAAAGADDSLDGEEHLTDQLDALPHLCRFQYRDTADFIVSLLDPRLTQYQQYASGATNGSALEVLEGQLTWLVHIVGAIIRGRMNNSGADTQETIDGDLAARIFALAAVSDTGAHAARHGARTRQRLDLAVLEFFQNFRKVYVGEQVVHSSRVYAKLRERCGIGDHLSVMAAMLGKIATNLKAYGGYEEVIDATLVLFADLAAGYMSGKLMLKLEAVGYLLRNHTAEHYPFLSHPNNMRARTTYYFTLSRLLFMDDTPGAFKGFMTPLGQTLSGIAAAAGSGSAALRAAVPQETVIGLFRDLRGIAAATSNRRIYGQFFEWLYPAHFPAMLACLDAWADTPEVTTPLLKFLSEFVQNKTQRLTFDSSSPNGILLFREVSKALMTYGRHVLTMAPPASDPYGRRYKGIWICFQILTRSLSGNYVNFGVFELYGDPALRVRMYS